MFQPIMMKDVDLILGDEATGTNFKCQLRSVTLTPNAPLADAEACDPSLMKISNSAFWSGLPFHPLPEYTWMSTDDESPLLVR